MSLGSSHVHGIPIHFYPILQAHPRRISWRYGQSARPAFGNVDLARFSAADFGATDEASDDWSAADDGGDCDERADFLPLAAGGVTAAAEDDETGEVELGDLTLSGLALTDGGVDTSDACDWEADLDWD